jgi:hypothetical protein
MSDKACEVEANQGQQPYNICMGKAEEQIDEDYASFYNNLQLLPAFFTFRRSRPATSASSRSDRS